MLLPPGPLSHRWRRPTSMPRGRGCSTSGSMAAFAAGRPPRKADGRGKQGIAVMMKTHPCSICGAYGHWHRDCPQAAAEAGIAEAQFTCAGPLMDSARTECEAHSAGSCQPRGSYKAFVIRLANY